MPTQVFKITRAPESKSLTAQELRSLLWSNRRDSEWVVEEVGDKSTINESVSVNYREEDVRCLAWRECDHPTCRHKAKHKKSKHGDCDKVSCWFATHGIGGEQIVHCNTVSLSH